MISSPRGQITRDQPAPTDPPVLRSAKRTMNFSCSSSTWRTVTPRTLKCFDPTQLREKGWTVNRSQKDRTNSTIPTILMVRSGFSFLATPLNHCLWMFLAGSLKSTDAGRGPLHLLYSCVVPVAVAFLLKTVSMGRSSEPWRQNPSVVSLYGALC